MDVAELDPSWSSDIFNPSILTQLHRPDSSEKLGREGMCSELRSQNLAQYDNFVVQTTGKITFSRSEL